MKFFIVATLFIASTCSASYLGAAVSSQYQSQDGHGQYTYGYAEPNSQKTETRSANGVTSGAYSYVDAHGIVQSVKYVSDPVHGFQVAATNLPKGPAPAPVAVYAAPAPVVHYAAPWGYHSGPAAALTHDGVPAETPEVQAAKAAHFAAHAAARAGHHLYKRSAGWGYAAPWAYAAPVIHNGVPVETPEVQHAKAAHFAAHAKALSGAHGAGAHYGYAHAPAPLAHNGVVVDTPEVEHAKAAHFAAHAAARSGHAYAPSAHYAAAPVIHNGVPVDTPEVQHAKAAHFAAVAEAKSQAYSAPHAVAEWNGASSGHYYGPQHIPVIHNGVPVETPEVQHAKAAHLAAVAEAGARSYDHGQWDNGHYDNGHWDNGHRDW